MLNTHSHNNTHKTKMTNFAVTLLVAILATATFQQSSAQHCRPFGHFLGRSPPPGKCDASVFNCCEEGKVYHTYHCSPPLSWEGETKAVLALNNFEAGGPADCDNLRHSDEEAVVGLPTGWYGGGKRCGKEILIKGKEGKSVRARVVDECDSTWGCDELHAYEAPCKHSEIRASRGVWRELGVPKEEWKEMEVTWVDV